MTIADPAAFIRNNTRIQTVPHAPEISLWLADEVTQIWRLTEDALDQIGLAPPFWAFAWAGGQGLARWVLDNPREVADKQVLDFATGSGLVGIAAMKAGAKSILCADIDPFCGAAVQMNGALNGVTLDFITHDLLDAPAPDVDVICAGDVFYEKPMAERVLPWLTAAHRRGIRVLVGDPIRTYFPKGGFDLLAEYQVPTTRELEDMAIKRTRVWALADG
ncbi:class I SAM-dependent methyltransferase [Brevundimonas sp.]